MIKQDFEGNTIKRDIFTRKMNEHTSKHEDGTTRIRAFEDRSVGETWIGISEEARRRQVDCMAEIDNIH